MTYRWPLLKPSYLPFKIKSAVFHPYGIHQNLQNTSKYQWLGNTIFKVAMFLNFSFRFKRTTTATKDNAFEDIETRFFQTSMELQGGRVDTQRASLSLGSVFWGSKPLFPPSSLIENQEVKITARVTGKDRIVQPCDSPTQPATSLLQAGVMSMRVRLWGCRLGQ